MPYDAMKYHYQNKNTRFFEGWYYKCQSDELGIVSVIFGVSNHEEHKQSFIQVVHDSDIAGYYAYPFARFHYEEEPFSIHIGESYITKDKLYLRLGEDEETKDMVGISFTLEINFMEQTTLPSSWVSPTIMGPLQYLSLPCYHHIIALRSRAIGSLTFENQKEPLVVDGPGYMEKDYGVSFPTSYVWSQGSMANAMYVISIATIPIRSYGQLGFFAVFSQAETLIKFATYLGGKVKACAKHDNCLNIVLIQGSMQASLQLTYEKPVLLRAPQDGKMSGEVEEFVGGMAYVVVKKHQNILFHSEFPLIACEVCAWEILAEKFAKLA